MKQKNRHAKEKYDVFLSYRRDGGMEMAMLLKDALTKKRYSVFLDIEGLRSGPFNEKLYEIIDGCTDFVIILPPNALDRCNDEQDWVRLEIERAKKDKKNIVPIILKGFSFPEVLPQSIEFIRYQTAPTVVNEYFDAFVEKLTTFLWSSPNGGHKRPWKGILLSAVGVVVIIAAGFAIYQWIENQKSQPEPPVEPPMSTVTSPVEPAAETASAVVDDTEKTSEAGQAGEKESVLLDPWYSVNGYPSWDDVVAIGDGDRIKAPPADSYLAEYQTKYVNATKGNSIYVFKTPGSETSSETVEHGAKVYVIAEKEPHSLVIFRTGENAPRSGWVSTRLLSYDYPGTIVSIGEDDGGNAINVGDPSTTWSGKMMEGTTCEYLSIDDPIRNCIGFTLEYRVQYNGYDNCSGTRNIYVNDGEEWKYVGCFDYENTKSFHVIVNLNVPITLCAVATPLSVEREMKSAVRTCVLDILVDKDMT